MENALDGFMIDGYRNLAESYIGPFTQMNIFSGINNSGKSNVLRFIRNHYPTFLAASKVNNEMRLANDDQQEGRSPTPIRFSIATKRLDLSPIENIDALSSFSAPAQNYVLLKKFLGLGALRKGTDLVWVDVESNSDRKAVISESQVNSILEEMKLPAHQWWEHLNPEYFGIRVQPSREKATQVIRAFLQHFLSLKKTTDDSFRLLREFRRINNIGKTTNPDSLDDEVLGGSGAIELLRTLEAPIYANRNRTALKDRFEKINGFLAEVTGEKSARLKVAGTGPESEIQVSMNGRELPLLTHLGTGIHQVILLAIVATSLTEKVICIEEPEIHLHPILQRKLIRYLGQTDNQYFITTHSPSIIDTEGASIFHVVTKGNLAHVEFVCSPSRRWELCSDLGCRASDIVQANCVIWVEGPSDRIYLNHWLGIQSKELVEGLHYSVMFYGGKLLSHLSADADTEDQASDDLNDFIELRKLNRNVAILIDSDLKAIVASIRDAKQRINDELEKSSGFCWVTAGREVENYLDPVKLQNVLTALYKNNAPSVIDQPFVGILNSKKQNKVKVAHAYVALDVASIPDRFGLREVVKGLSDYIWSCN